MNFKKTIAKSLVVAMALGMVPVANLQTAKAAAPTDAKLVGTSGLVTADGKPTHWAAAKLVGKAGKGTIEINSKHYKISNVQEYAEGGIDIYAVLKGKAGAVAIGTTATPDKVNWTVVEVPAVEKTLKVQYVANKTKVKGLNGAATKALGKEFGYLVATKVENKKTVEVEINDKLEGKLNDGSWQELKNLFGTLDDDGVNKKLKIFAQNGSTLTFRFKAKDGEFASKEAKVKITPQAKAPAVKVDTTKETVSIKKGMDWQVVKIENAAVAPAADKWVTAEPTKKSMTIKELKVGGKAGTALVNTENYALFVRSSATDKKIASKYSMVTLKARPTALKFKDDKLEGSEAEIQDSNDKLVGTVKSVLSYDISKGALLTNTSANDWEYALSKAEPTKWNTLKAPKNAKKPSVAKLKYSKEEKANTFGWEGAKLYLRVAGTKQTKEGVATLSGVTVSKDVNLAKKEQALTFTNSSANNATDDTSDLAKLNPKYKIATGTAAVITVKAKIDPVVKADVAPKIKVTKGPKVKVKAGKVTKEGIFDITIDISKSLFKTPESIANVEFNLKFEGVDKDFTLGLAKKN